MNEISVTILKYLYPIALIIGVIYLSMSFLLFFTQASIVYQPRRMVLMTPADAGLEYEAVEYEAADGVRISAWYIPAKEKEPKRVVLFCHGNAGNIGHRIETIAIFNKLGLDTFVFDYRGYGKSGGKPSEEGTHLDAVAAREYLLREKGVKPEELILAGRSLGGAVACRLAAEKPPAGLIIESSFTSVPDLGAGRYPYLPVKLLCRFDYETAEYVKQVKCPVLVIHSPEDELIPIRHGEKIFESANEPKRFMRISGSHNEGFKESGEQYVAGLREFLVAGD